MIWARPGVGDVARSGGRRTLDVDPAAAANDLDFGGQELISKAVNDWEARPFK